MANHEHLDILTQGAEAWSQWRKENPEVKPDLSGVDFTKARLKLRKSDFSSTDFTGAKLTKVDITEANFWHADFTGADLRKANIGGSVLWDAVLEDADLSGANIPQTDFTDANLQKSRMKKTYAYGSDFSNAKLSGADLSGALFAKSNLYSADLSGANLSNAYFDSAYLMLANLSNANLTKTRLKNAYIVNADLSNAKLVDVVGSDVDLSGANLTKANVRKARLNGANFFRANLTQADLRDCNLSGAMLVETDLSKANLTDSTIYGISAWNVIKDETIQKNLRITPVDEPVIRVDSIEMGQFLYLLLSNQQIRDVVDTITSKVVLILGRFKPERKAILDALREAIRRHGYLPILFDFDVPGSRDITETVSTLAHMARFIIADITDAKSIPQELQAIIPNLPSVPVQPLLLAGVAEYAMFEHFKRYPWVLETYVYKSQRALLASIEKRVILPAENKLKELNAI